MVDSENNVPEKVWMVRNGGQGEIRTRDFCLAKAAIYRADLLAHLNPVNPP